VEPECEMEVELENEGFNWDFGRFNAGTWLPFNFLFRKTSMLIKTNGMSVGFEKHKQLIKR